MKKLSTVMAVVMLFVSLCFTANAQNGTIKVTASSGNVNTGAELTVSVDFSENTGFNTLGVKLTYPEGFTYVEDSAAPSALIAEKCYLSFGGYEGETYTLHHDSTARTITFIGASLYDITETSGTLFTARFTAPATAASGKTFAVEIIDDVYGENGDSLTATPGNGTVNVNPSYKLGDVNMDGYVNNIDALWVLQSMFYVRTLTAEQKALGDVNHDGYTNNVDALFILQAFINRTPLQ
jgi:hypothetical protein